MLGNLEKWPASHVFGVVQGRYVKADDIRNLGFGQSGGIVDHAREHQGRPDPVGLGRQGLLQPGLQRPGLRPRVAGLQQGQGRLPHRRLLARRPTWPTAMGADVTFMLPAGTRGRRHARHDRRHGPAVRDHAARRSTRTPPRLHQLHHQRRRDEGARRDRQPAGRRDRRAEGARRASAPTSSRPSARSSKDDGLVPYLDYATPTMGDTLGADAAGPPRQEGHPAAGPRGAAEGLRQLHRPVHG